MRPLVDRAMLTSGIADYDRLLTYLESELARAPDDPVLRHYKGFGLYRKASLLAATTGDAKGANGKSATDPKVVRAVFESAERELERASAGLDWPENRALRAAVAGQLISVSGPLAGIRLGPRSSRLLDQALSEGPNNPRVWMLRGVAELYKPRLLGGSLDKAEANLRRAITLFAQDVPAPPRPWWGHAESYGWLGQVLARQGRPAEARAAYATALAMQPGNVWVERFLLPALERESP